MSNVIEHLDNLNVTKQQLREEYVAENWHHLGRVIDIVRQNCELYRNNYRQYIRHDQPERTSDMTEEQIDLEVNSIIDKFLYKVGDKIIDIVLHKGDNFTVDINRGEFKEGLFTCEATIRWTNGDGFDIKTSIRWNRHSVESNDFFVQYPLTFSKIIHNGVVSTSTAQLDVGNLFGVPPWAAPARYLKKISNKIRSGTVVLLSNNTLGYVVSFSRQGIRVFGESGTLYVPETAILAVLGQVTNKTDYNISTRSFVTVSEYKSWFGKNTNLMLLQNQALAFDPRNPVAQIHRQRCTDWTSLWRDSFGSELEVIREDAVQILNLINDLRVFGRHRSLINRFFMIGQTNQENQSRYREFVPTPIQDSMYEVSLLRRQQTPVVQQRQTPEQNPTPVANAIWKKLRNGDWGLLVENGATVRAGDAVKVSKRSGTTSVEIIDQVVESTPHGIFCVVKKKEYRRHG